MSLIEWLALAGSLVAGTAIGAAYFGSLWWTVRRIPAARHPALLTLGSFLARTVLLLVGFYVVMGGRWERLAACLAGFLLARSLLLRRLRSEPPKAQRR